MYIHTYIYCKFLLPPKSQAHLGVSLVGNRAHFSFRIVEGPQSPSRATRCGLEIPTFGVAGPGHRGRRDGRRDATFVAVVRRFHRLGIYATYADIVV